jgi:hypothetical protein
MIRIFFLGFYLHMGLVSPTAALGLRALGRARGRAAWAAAFAARASGDARALSRGPPQLRAGCEPGGAKEIRFPFLKMQKLQKIIKNHRKIR